MVNLYFQPDAQLTTQDRMVLDILQKDNERHQKSVSNEASEDSDDSGKKHTRLGSASPEGRPPSHSPHQDHAHPMQMPKRSRNKLSRS